MCAQFNRGGPWVNMAVLCESTGKDDQGRAFVSGLMDHMTVEVRTAAPMPSGQIEVTTELLLSLQLVAGAPHGRIQLRIDVEGEDGLMRLGTEQTVHFDHARQQEWLTIRLQVAFWREGNYWINVIGNGRLLTRIPFRVDFDFASSPN